MFADPEVISQKNSTGNQPLFQYRVAPDNFSKPFFPPGEAVSVHEAALLIKTQRTQLFKLI
jgi:hypothetical protein